MIATLKRVTAGLVLAQSSNSSKADEGVVGLTEDGNDDDGADISMRPTPAQHLHGRVGGATRSARALACRRRRIKRCPVPSHATQQR